MLQYMLQHITTSVNIHIPPPNDAPPTFGAGGGSDAAPSLGGVISGGAVSGGAAFGGDDAPPAFESSFATVASTMIPFLQQKLAMLPQYVQGVKSNDPTVQLEATTEIRELLSIEKKKK